MNLRDWLIIAGVIILVGILIDGFRRMRLAKKDSLQMAKDMGGDFENTPLDDFNPELPAGGARVVSNDISQEQKIEPKVGDAPIVESEVNSAPDVISADPQARIEVENVEVDTANKSSATVAEATSSEHELDPLVVVINVHAKNNLGFSGVEIKKLLEACGLDHGDMSIFHRHEQDDLLSPVQFSVANAIEPGYFDPNTLETISTPGVSFFMSLPGPKDYAKAFEYMLETAQCFANNLQGDLKDEQLSILTSQTIEHNRQRIKDFERLQLSKSRV